MPKVVECVPNFSEGRDQKVLHFHVLTKYILKKPDVKKNYAFRVKCLITKKAITTTLLDDGNVIFILYKTLLSHLILYLSISVYR